MEEFLWTSCDARIHVACLAILVHTVQDVSHYVLIIGASQYVITFYYRDMVILEVKLFHEAYNTIKDMFWHCQPLRWVLVSSPNASRVRNSLLFDINRCIWCVRLCGGCSRKRSPATVLAIAQVVPKCLTWGDTGSNGIIHCFLGTQRTTTRDTHKSSRKLLRILGALTTYSSVHDTIWKWGHWQGEGGSLLYNGIIIREEFWE